MIGVVPDRPALWKNLPSLRGFGGGDGVGFEGDGDSDVVGDPEERVAPGHAEVPAIEHERGGDAGGRCREGAFRLDRDLARDAADGQVARDAVATCSRVGEVAPAAGEGDGWAGFGVEEVLAQEVLVAAGVTGVDGPCV